MTLFNLKICTDINSFFDFETGAKLFVTPCFSRQIEIANSFCVSCTGSFHADLSQTNPALPPPPLPTSRPHRFTIFTIHHVETRKEMPAPDLPVPSSFTTLSNEVSIAVVVLLRFVNPCWLGERKYGSKKTSKLS